MCHLMPLYQSWIVFQQCTQLQYIQCSFRNNQLSTVWCAAVLIPLFLLTKVCTTSPLPQEQKWLLTLMTSSVVRQITARQLLINQSIQVWRYFNTIIKFKMTSSSQHPCDKVKFVVGSGKKTDNCKYIIDHSHTLFNTFRWQRNHSRYIFCPIV